MASADKPQTAGHGRNAIVAGLLLALGLGWGVWRLADAGLKPADMAPAAWLDGSAGGALNRALRLPAQDTLNTWNASLRYRLLETWATRSPWAAPAGCSTATACAPGPACMCSTSACA